MLCTKTRGAVTKSRGSIVAYAVTSGALLSPWQPIYRHIMLVQVHQKNLWNKGSKKTFRKK